MIFHNLKSILISRNLAACYYLIASPSSKDFKGGASINVTLYGFWVIQDFRAKKLFFCGQIHNTEVVSCSVLHILME